MIERDITKDKWYLLGLNVTRDAALDRTALCCSGAESAASSVRFPPHGQPPFGHFTIINEFCAP